MIFALFPYSLYIKVNMKSKYTTVQKFKLKNKTVKQ